MAAKLDAVRRGSIKRLIINVPPRHLKSICASVAFPAWCLGHDPAAQVLCVSYAQDLSDKLARDCRGILASTWYRQLFATRLSPQRQAVQEFATTAHGFRMATSIGGVLTGRGADLIVIDDPLKPEEALSDAQRRAANAWYDHTLYSRLNDKRHGAIVLIMQRLHEDDLVGHVLDQEPWEVVRFPAIAEAPEEHRIETPLGPRRFTRRIGDVLDPTREPEPTLARIRRTLGEYNFAGQYQQAPAPMGGGLVKRDWFRTYTPLERPTRFERIVQSWDTANKATELSDFSVCTTWGIAGRNAYLLHVLRQRLDYPDLKRAVREQQAFHPSRRGADRRQGVGHPAHTGARPRRPLRRPALPARARQDHALTRPDRDDRERLRSCPPGPPPGSTPICTSSRPSRAPDTTTRPTPPRSSSTGSNKARGFPSPRHGHTE